MIFDLVSQKWHTKYFNQTRGNYLSRRVCIIAWILVIFQPSWLIVDYFLLPVELLPTIITARLICAVAGLFLAMLVYGYSLRQAYLHLILLAMILTLFHTASSQAIIYAGYGHSIAGYHFFPFMVMVMMAVFPLSIIETIVYIIAILSMEVLTQIFRGTLGTVDGINNLWLLSVLGGIAGWASVNQLNMLLTLYRQATRDPLTGLSNRRQAIEQMSSDIGQAREHNKPVTALMLDLDKFKNFNDTYGHAAGDMVLKAFAKILQKYAKRQNDLICRYGGEEFLVVMPGMGLEQGADIAESIRLACHNKKVRTPNGDKIGFTTSIGVAEIKEDEDIDAFLHRTDEFLYKAKDSGRDRISVDN